MGSRFDMGGSLMLLAGAMLCGLVFLPLPSVSPEVMAALAGIAFLGMGGERLYKRCKDKVNGENN